MLGNPLLLVVFIIMLILVRAVPVFVATTLDANARRPTGHGRCTTALPVIVAVTSVAVGAGTMQEDTASTLVAAGAVSVFLMPLIAGVTGRIRKRQAATPRI